MTSAKLRARIIERQRLQEEARLERMEEWRNACDSSVIVMENGERVRRQPRASGSKPGYGLTAPDPVRDSDEVRRIAALPSYDWDKDPELEKLIDDLTMWLKTKKGTMRLRPVQAAALQAIHDRGGCLGAIGVGEGKTLISYLACKVLDLDRLVLLVPAKLREKTKRDFDELSQHWFAPSEITVISYEMLGRIQGESLLREKRPQIIVADEAHRLKNKKAACTRRVARYLYKYPDTKFVALSGTMTNRSLSEFAHLARWCLGDPFTPLPNNEYELGRWCQAIDEKVETRLHPGVLSQFTESGEDITLSAVRKGVSRRVYGTPGVVRTSVSTVEASIVIEPFEFPERSAEVKDALKRLYEENIAPNGDEALPSDIWRITRELTLGFYYFWMPPPPDDWMYARRRWKRFVREAMEGSEMDSEDVVRRECEHGRLFSNNRFEDWKAIRDTYTPRSIARFLDFDPLRHGINYINQMVRDRPGNTKYPLVWVEHRAVGNRLEKLTGWNYYHRKGLTEEGKSIDDHDPEYGPAIVSIAANSEGRNLQHWNSNFVFTPPSSGAVWEQMIGRTHRTGQKSDEVRFVVAMGHQSIYNTWSQVLADARYVADTTGQPQKLLQASLLGRLAR